MSKTPKTHNSTIAETATVPPELQSAADSQGEFVLYTTDDGLTRVEMRAEGGSLWLSQAEIATLFQTTPQNVTQHVKAIYAEGEADAEATCKSSLQVRQEGGRQVRRSVRFYSLEVVLAVGYRARSARGTQFRQWATAHLSEYLLKGFVMDDERLKNPPVGDSVLSDRFGELLDRIRDIRASERRMYLRVREIFALAADYAPSLPETTAFFRIIQNKLHYAVSGQTAAEIIRTRADHTRPNMGLNTTRKGRVQKADVGVAKNYLNENEITELNRIVTMWLDFAEDQATRRKEVFLKDWAEKLDAFLSFNDRQVLLGAGKVSHKQAVAHAQSEYEQFTTQRRVALEAEGEVYAVRMLGTESTDEKSLGELGQIAKRLAKKKGRYVMYPHDWRACSLSDVTEKVMVGIASAATHAYCKSGVPMLRNLNIRPGYIDEQEILQIDSTFEVSHKNKRLTAGDVLVVRTGYPGVSAVVPRKYEGAQCFTSLIVRPMKTELCADYFCQYMNSEFGERLSSAAEAGGAQKNLNAGELEKMPLHLPPIREQERIAEQLSKWDQAIATTKRLLANSQRCTRDLMASMLSGHRRFPEFSEKWRYVDLDTVFERVARKNTTQNTNVLTISGEHGLISQRDYFNKSVASANLSGYTLLHRNDFAYNKSYSTGYPMGAVKPLLAYDTGVVSSLYLCFRLRGDVDADFDFFRHYFEAGLLNQEIEGIAQEGARNHGLLNVSVTEFFKLQLHIPNAPEQRRIAEVINVARAEEMRLEAQVQALLREKTALMSQLLTGKRRVKLPDAKTEAQT